MYNNIQAKFCPHTHPQPLNGDKSSNQFFSESSRVPYRIKGNKTYDNMQANILPLHTPSTPGWGLKVKTFFFSDSSHVAYQMNRKVGHAHTMVIYTMGGLGEWGRFPLIW